MPRVSQLMVRAALLHLALGSALGGLALAEKGLHMLPWLWALKASHAPILLVGMMVQLACGVAVWILPRLDAAGDRGDMRPVWLGFAALNSGVALAALHPPLAALLGADGLRWMPPLAAALLLLAGIALARHAWGRALPFRELPRAALATRRARPRAG